MSTAASASAEGPAGIESRYFLDPKAQKSDDPKHFSDLGKETPEHVVNIIDSSIPGAAQFHPSLRNAFLRRVYGILAMQMIATIGVCLLCMFQDGMRKFMLYNARGVMWGTIIPALVLLVALYFTKNKYPVNMILLSLFTLTEAAVVGCVCAIYYVHGAGIAIAQAAVLTAIVFLSLSAYCFISKRDFSWMGGFLFTSLLILIGWGFINLLFGFRTTWLISLFGALLFCGFILFDTWRISEQYNYDDYIPAAIDLYLDIINLFLYILSLFGRNDS